jgi:acetylornithine deacetylase/succinyl-diaminopimelate desuccinylase-like protein
VAGCPGHPDSAGRRHRRRSADGALIAVGIPTYGVSGIFYEPDLGRIHGLNERIGVQSLMEGREFSYRLVKLYAEQKD